MLGTFYPQFPAVMFLVCLFLAALLHCGMGVVSCLSCGLAYGEGIACPVFLADAIWACVEATLNWWGGVHGYDNLLGIFLSSEASGV